MENQISKNKRKQNGIRQNTIKQAVLLGNPGTKRTDYFRQAAKQEKLPVFFTDWKGFDKWVLQEDPLVQNVPFAEESLIKIDPPLWESSSLNDLSRLSLDYIKNLERLAALADAHSYKFLNHPFAIMQLLDKQVCKRTLSEAGLAVTEMLPSVKSAEELMEKSSTHRVFIKPLRGSGAAGVTAFRWQPSTRHMALYTCVANHPKFGLVNTKQLRRFSRQKEVLSLLDQILELDCMVERWYAKAEYQGYAYDLRVVVLEDKVVYIVARLSKGPITNLQLNNHPLALSELHLSANTLKSIEDLCIQAMGCFPGLRCAGIDVLLEKETRTPRIIEMNAQGDLLYQDIYQENIIYRSQAKWIKNRMEGNEGYGHEY